MAPGHPAGRRPNYILHPPWPEGVLPAFPLPSSFLILKQWRPVALTSPQDCAHFIFWGVEFQRPSRPMTAGWQDEGRALPQYLWRARPGIDLIIWEMRWEETMMTFTLNLPSRSISEWVVCKVILNETGWTWVIYSSVFISPCIKIHTIGMSNLLFLIYKW